LFAGLQRWGYITIEPPAGEVLNKAPQPAAVVRVTPAGRGAQDVWRALPAVIEERWHARFGSPTVDQLTAALSAVYAALPFDPPAFLPVVYPTQNGKTENPPLRNPGSHGGSAALDLSALLAGVLLAFTVDFESESRISLTISANTLRVLTAEGVRVRDLPGLTGVSKEGNAMAVGWLERRGCAESVPEPGAARGKLVRLTEKGSRAQAKYRRVLRDTEERWRTGYGADALNALSAALHPLVGDGTLASSALAQGLEPAPANWRARVRTPETLPHHPMVLHRGGYPDGS
jgi:DNA-binding MarR family transcriptional regulator